MNKHLLSFLSFSIVVGALLVCVPDISLANIEIPGSDSVSEAEVRQKANNLKSTITLYGGLAVGLGIIIAISIGSFFYTTKQFSKGHSWMVGALIGIVAGTVGLILARQLVEALS